MIDLSEQWFSEQDWNQKNEDRFPAAIIILHDDFGDINGLDSSRNGKLYDSNPREGELFDTIQNLNHASTEIGEIYW